MIEFICNLIVVAFEILGLGLIFVAIICWMEPSIREGKVLGDIYKILFELND